MMAVANIFGDNIMRQAPVANYHNFQGLPIFTELAKDFLNKALKLKQSDDTILEILYVNKQASQAC